MCVREGGREGRREGGRDRKVCSDKIIWRNCPVFYSSGGGGGQGIFSLLSGDSQLVCMVPAYLLLLLLIHDGHGQ